MRKAWFALPALSVFLAGCLSPSDDGTRQGRRSPLGNGEAYGAYTSYLLEADYSCVKDTGERIPSYTKALLVDTGGNARLKGDLCSTEEPVPVASSRIERSIYYPELSGLGPNTFERHAQEPSTLDRERYFVEAWCRSEGATESEGFDVSIHYSLYDLFPRARFRKGAVTQVDLPAPSFVYDRTAERLETSDRVNYRMVIGNTTHVSLDVYWDRPMEGEDKFEGRFTNVTTGTSVAMRCRAVSIQKTFTARMARLGTLMGLPPVPETGGTFYRFNGSRSCLRADGSPMAGYLGALMPHPDFSVQRLPSLCAPDGLPQSADPAMLETSSYNPRYIGYGSEIYEYRPQKPGSFFWMGRVPLVWCRTVGATADEGMDLVVLFLPGSEMRGLRFSSDGRTKTMLGDQYFVGHMVLEAPVTFEEGKVIIRNQVAWRDIKLEIATTALPGPDGKFPATLLAMSQGRQSLHDMTCRVSNDIIPE